MKLVTVIGARPQFVKAAAVTRVLCTVAGVDEQLVHTGQHYDTNMSDLFFEELEIPSPRCNLGVGQGTHGEQTARMLAALERLLLDERPDWLLVYGDTNSTLAGALAAVKLHVPVAHVEAGLRSFNRRMPEEINRVLTDHASDLLFAPTQTARDNLRREGIDESRVFVVGDVMYDAAVHFGARAEMSSRVLDRLGIQSKRYVLATVHRAENTDSPDRLAAIFEGLGRLAQDIPVVLPLHPRTRKALVAANLFDGNKKIHVIEPVGYLDMVMLEKHARLIATDSGGVQKEAFFYRVPCVTLRDETEWTELVELGWNRLAPPHSARSVSSMLLAGLEAKAGKEGEPYGQADAAKRIVEVLMSKAATPRI